jgi:Na+/melibiose symporter-like transporter
MNGYRSEASINFVLWQPVKLAIALCQIGMPLFMTSFGFNPTNLFQTKQGFANFKDLLLWLPATTCVLSFFIKFMYPLYSDFVCARVEQQMQL